MRAHRSSDPLALEAILDKDVEVVEVLGAVPQPVEDFARALVTSRRLCDAVQVRCALGADVEDDSARPAGDFALLPQLPGRAEFTAWAEHWMEGFASLNDTKTVGMRIAHLRGPMCPRFHVDQVPSRMIATLVGPGTEWVPDTAVRRDCDGRIAQDVEAADIRQLEPGSIGLFKGAGFADAHARGVVHRSPQDHTDRIIMTLDALA